MGHELFVVLEAQLQGLQQLVLVQVGIILLLIGNRLGSLNDQIVGAEGLKLGGIRACIRGNVDEPPGDFHIAVVVDTDFGNDKASLRAHSALPGQCGHFQQSRRSPAIDSRL